MKKAFACVAMLVTLFTLTSSAYADVAAIAMGSMAEELYPVFGVGQNALESKAQADAIQDCTAQGGVNCVFIVQTTEMGTPLVVIGGVVWGQLTPFVGTSHPDAVQQCWNAGAWCYNNIRTDRWAAATANPFPPVIMDADGSPPPPTPYVGGSGSVFVAGLSGFSPDNIPLGVGANEQAAKDSCAAQTPGGKQPCYLLKDPVDASANCVIVGIFKMPNRMFEPHSGATREQATANAGPGAKLIQYKGPLCP